jgi:hypothetical protein
MIDNAVISKNQRLVRIRQKINDVFGWNCTMNDDMLVKCNSITIDGELVMILKQPLFIQKMHAHINKSRGLLFRKEPAGS